VAHKLKTFGVALMAVFALSAVAAVAAQAAEYKSESASTFIHGVQATTNVFTTGAGTVKCEEATFSGTQTGASAKDLTLTPKYGKCKAFGSAAEVTMHGCQYTFTQPTGASSPFSAEVDIVNCESGKHIEVDVPLGNCTLTIFPLTGNATLGGSVDLTNQGSGTTRDVLVTSTITGIKTIAEGTGTICGSKTVEETTGSYTGTVTTKGYTNSSMVTQVGVFVG
jgi:hypothetical protein